MASDLPEVALKLADSLNLPTPVLAQKPALKLVGLNKRYAFSDRDQIPLQWQAFDALQEQIQHKSVDGHFGAAHNASREDCQFDYFSGVAVASFADQPSACQTLDVAAAKYVIFTHEAHVSGLPLLIDRIWSEWVPAAGLRFADAPCVEHYSARFNPATGMHGMAVWLALQ